MATGPDGGKAPAFRMPGDRATAPVPLEDTSDTAWEEFSQLQSRSESGTSDPVPVSASTPAPAPATARPSHEPVTVVSTMLLARSGNRVCPVAAHWAALYALLPVRDGKAPPAALSATDGNRISSIQKRLRLRDQIEWASATGCLPEVHRFLGGLPESAWEHFEGG